MYYKSGFYTKIHLSAFPAQESAENINLGQEVEHMWVSISALPHPLGGLAFWIPLYWFS